MKKSLLLSFMLLIVLTTSLAQENYVPFNPHPEDDSFVIPLDRQVSLSWDCYNPYQKTVSYTVKLLINGTKEMLFEDLKSRTINIDVHPGDKLEWNVVSKVYEKSFTGPAWNFRVPKEFIHVFGDNDPGSFADAARTDNSFTIITNQIIEGKYSAKMLTLESNGTIIEEKNILWNDFYAYLIADNKLIGHLFDEKGYRLGIYNLTRDTTSSIDNEHFSTVHEIDEIKNGFLVTGISDKRSKILTLDKSLQIVDKNFSDIIAYTADYLDKILVVAGKKWIGNVYVPAVSIKKSDGQWVYITLEIAGAFTDCKITDDGFYVLGQIASLYKGTQDLIVSKYDLTGNLLWNNFIDNHGDDVPGKLIIKDALLKVLGTYYTNKSYSTYIVNYTTEGKTSGVSFFDSKFNEFPAEFISTNIGNFIFGNVENDYEKKIFMRFTGN
ncbi:MAG: hypothetical protein FXF54_03775 [Kosmotoga sp.]|nr:MAG: hypothetical protein FXF54_03775 [Kosmotoga sp.]